MIRPGSGLWRSVRGGLLAAVSTAMAAAGHAVGGGRLPPLGALLAIGILLGAAFVVLADRRRGFAEILPAALGAQAAFHVGFGLTGHGAPAVDGPMVVGHLLGAAVLAALGAHSESVLWALVGLLGWARIPTPVWLSVAGPPAVGPEPWDLPAPRSRVEISINPRRGPPRR